MTSKINEHLNEMACEFDKQFVFMFFFSEKGEVKLNTTDSMLSIGGPNCIVGRSVVLHEKADDLGQGGDSSSLTTGNAGNFFKRKIR